MFVSCSSSKIVATKLDVQYLGRSSILQIRMPKNSEKCLRALVNNSVDSTSRQKYNISVFVQLQSNFASKKLHLISKDQRLNDGFANKVVTLDVWVENHKPPAGGVGRNPDLEGDVLFTQVTTIVFAKPFAFYISSSKK